MTAAPSPSDCIHLDVRMVLDIHHEAIRVYGGSHGLRDRAHLEAAVAAPQAMSGGRSVFASLVEIAAAYLFYLCRNHPFIDGNKKTALGACLVFLALNDLPMPRDDDRLYRLVMAVAEGLLSREQITQALTDLI